MFKKYHWIEFCPAINVRGEMITLGDLPNKRTHYGVDKPMFISRYMFDNSGLPPLGTVLSPFYLDFDDAENPHRALMELLDAAERFIEMGVDEDDMKVRFTGGKGGSLEVPFQCFDVKPSRELPQIWRHIADYVKSAFHYKTLDLAVYDRRRLWRLTNSQHRSGRYKIPLTLDEIRSLTMKQIYELAEKPRSYEWVDDKQIEAEPVPKLRALYMEAGKAVRKAKKKWKKRVTERSEEWAPSKIFPCVALIIENGIDARQFQRNPTAFNIAVSLNSLNAPDDVILELLLAFAQKCDPPLPESRYPELEHCIDMAKKHEYTTHCKTPVFEAHCVGQKNCWIFQKKSKDVIKEVIREEFSPEIVDEANVVLNDNNILEWISTNPLGDTFLEYKTKMSALVLQFINESILIGGVTSTGKSHIADKIMGCIPTHWWIKFTSISDKHLRYMHDHPEIRTLYFAEFAAVKIGTDDESSAEYDMKMIMSEGELRSGTVQKVDGRLTTTENVVSIRNFVTTSTLVELSDELRNRQWALSTDRTINFPFVEYYANLEALPPWNRPNYEHPKKVLRCAIEIIDKEAPVKWWVPFLPELTPIFKPLKDRTDIRRNIQKLRKIIIGVAKLHYRNRPIIERNGIRYGIALPEDFYKAWQIGDEAIMGTLTEMTRRMEDVWKAMKVILEAGKKLNTNSLARAVSIVPRSARRWLKRMEDMGLLVPLGRDAAGAFYGYADKETPGRVSKEIKVEIPLHILYSCSNSILSSESAPSEVIDHIKRSSREFSKNKVVVFYPASICPFNVEDLPDDMHAGAHGILGSIGAGKMRGDQFLIWRDVQ